jgi:ABC-type transport system involved in multi-copper enzyme maturation permease subunit
MPGNETFTLVIERGWMRGMGNMLRSGLARWFKTRSWWVNSLIWGAVTVAVVGGLAFSRPEATPLAAIIMIFTETAGLFPAIGVVITMQDALVGEKREGTAAWVLSKPVTRQAFLLSKVISNSLGVLVSMVVVPMIIGYILISIDQQTLLNPISFLVCMLLIFIIDFFFLSLTLMLGVLFNNRAPVIGIPLAVVFLQQNLISLIPPLRFFLPSTLTFPQEGTNSLAISILLHTPVQQEQWFVLGIVLLECVLFVGGSLWKFNRQEF